MLPRNSLLDARARHIGLSFRTTDAVVQNDPELLEVILRNLINNALAYSHRGRVLVACRGCSDEVRVQVWDQGIGIAPEHQALIFQNYYQVTATTPKTAGPAQVGLGLGICGSSPCSTMRWNSIRNPVEGRYSPCACLGARSRNRPGRHLRPHPTRQWQAPSSSCSTTSRIFARPWRACSATGDVVSSPQPDSATPCRHWPLRPKCQPY